MLATLLLKKRPDIAEELLPLAMASDTKNIENIPEYYNLFCKINKLDPKKFKGKLYKRDLVKKRGMFILAMVHIYNQNVLYIPSTAPIMRNGFVNKLSCQIGISSATISYHIRQMLFNVSTYENDKKEIEVIIEQLKGKSF